MRDVIKEFYQSITEEDVDLYEKIYFGAQDGKIELLSEDIYPLCQLSIYDSDTMQPSDIVETIRMVFWAIERGDMEEGFKELVKGLEYIYYKVNADSRVYLKYHTADTYIYEYMSMAIFRYKKDELVLLGKVISENLSSTVVKREIVRAIKGRMNYNEDEEGVIENGNILIDSIKI